MGNILIGADHRGWRLKSIIVEKLRERGIAVEDLGYRDYDKNDDFADITVDLANRVVHEKTKGILICRTGIGTSIMANKVDGVRAGLCTLIKQARLARNDTDINILCLSADLVSQEKNLRIVNKFLNTIFSSGENYIRRINKIKQYESKKC
jgi:ribose 5-phosphate isomerase B